MARGLVRRGIALSLAAAMTMVLAGCVSFGSKPPKQLIALSAQSTAPVGALAGGVADKALVVLDPETDQRLDVLRVPVQVDDATVAYLKDAQWVERPARQFRRLLAETVRARGNRLVLDADGAFASARATLSGRLVDMGYDARTSSVVVRFDAMREDAGGTITSRRFEAVVPGVKPKAQAVAPALNQAANDVARQVADWIGQN